MDLIVKPMDIVFSIPFKIKDSIVPNVALHLNMMNVLKQRGKIIPNEILMKKFGPYFGSLTNQDVYLLYPQNNISSNIINCWTSW